jgi:hypothetical protein
MTTGYRWGKRNLGRNRNITVMAVAAAIRIIEIVPGIEGVIIPSVIIIVIVAVLIVIIPVIQFAPAIAVANFHAEVSIIIRFIIVSVLFF